MTIVNDKHYKVIGKTSIEELPRKRSWDPENGTQTRRKFVGTKEAIEQRFNEFSSAAEPGIDNMDETISGRKGELICRIYDDSGGEDGGNDETNSIWELLGRDIIKPIESYTPFNDNITGERMREIENAVTDLEEGDTQLTLNNTYEEQLAGCYSHQMLDYMTTQYILRQSIVVSWRSQLTTHHSDVNRVVSLDTINPPTVLFGTLNNLPKEDGTTGWEWLKKAPQVRQITRVKYRIVYEWIGAEQWSEIYGGTWDPRL